MTVTEFGRESLRRYCNNEKEKCPGPYRYHNAEIVLGDVPFPHDGTNGFGRDNQPHDDPRWPYKCDYCPYVFTDEDAWQHNMNRLYQGAPDGKLYTNRNMPPGAMYDADWLPVKGPDGIALAVVLPPVGGDDVWHPDGKSSSGGSWTRTGKIPDVTCSPSVLAPNYHGYLRAGWLEEV